MESSVLTRPLPPAGMTVSSALCLGGRLFGVGGGMGHQGGWSAVRGCGSRGQQTYNNDRHPIVSYLPGQVVAGGPLGAAHGEDGVLGEALHLQGLTAGGGGHGDAAALVAVVVMVMR